MSRGYLLSVLDQSPMRHGGTAPEALRARLETSAECLV